MPEGPGAPPRSTGVAVGMTAPSASLPPGWTEGVDPKSGEKYYFNASTGQTQWLAP